MAPYANIPFSPAELSYLHTSLSQTPPVRPDGRSQTDFRSLTAESDILPNANGSARICFVDGTEAIVGVKVEVEKTVAAAYRRAEEEEDIRLDESDTRSTSKARDEWLEISIDVPGTRDDDALSAYLASLLSEALLADGSIKERLIINNRFHWRLYVDVLLISPPLSYPLPLLSLTTHLALLDTRLPALVSHGDEDPLFNDDWAAATLLYPSDTSSRPPVTLLVMSVRDNTFYDPSREELAVADAVLAISLTRPRDDSTLKIVSMRTVDPPSRLTAAGVPRDLNTAGGGSISVSNAEALAKREVDEAMKVWRPPRGGLKRQLLSRIVGSVTTDGVVADVLDALSRVDS